MNPITHACRIFNTWIQLYTLCTAYKICQTVQVYTAVKIQNFEQWTRELVPSNIHKDSEHKWFLWHHRPPVWHFQKRNTKKETDTSSTFDAAEKPNLLTKMEVSEIMFNLSIRGVLSHHHPPEWHCREKWRRSHSPSRSSIFLVSVGARVFSSARVIVSLRSIHKISKERGRQAQRP